MALLAGCSGGEKTETGSTDTKTPDAGAKKFKVGLLTPGPVSDAGWSALAYDGLQSVKKELGAEVDNQEATGPKIKDAMRSYAQNHYDLVFGHGYEYNHPATEVAKDFPETIFVSSSGGETATNVGTFRFYLEQGCYLAGMIAGKMSKTGTVGSIAAIDVPSINSTLKAFAAGAKAANPNIKVLPIVYLSSGSSNDPAKAQQATEQVIARGADFVMQQANEAAKGVFDACKAKGVWAFGANADQNTLSDSVLGSATIISGPAFVDLAKQVQAKTYKGSVILMGMDKGTIDFVVNPKFASKIPADVLKLIETTKADIKSGKLVVPKDEF